MDLSGLKWPIIIVVVIGAVWLMSSGGMDYMYKNFTKAEVGADPQRDKSDEAGLTRLAGFLIKTLRFQKAEEVLETAVARYPNGANVWYNQYRLVKCAEKLKRYRRAVDILEMLIQNDAHAIDPRVPEHAILRARADKFIAVHELG